MWLTISRAQRAPAIVCAVALAVTVALVPVGAHQLGSTPSYVPAILAAVACFDVMSVWLLIGEYLDSGERRMLVMAAAYLWSLLVMTGYAMAFPGVFAAHPPLAVAPSVAPYLYVGWHTGFPTLLGAAWVPWRPIAAFDRPGSRAAMLRGVMAGAALVALTYVATCVDLIHHLPILINGLDTTAMARLTAPIALPLVLGSLVICGFGIRRRGGAAVRWTFVAILVCVCDLSLTYSSRYRFSVGWYAGRTMTVTAAAVVLVAMLASFRRLKGQAEAMAASDALTGLPNRRAAYDALTAFLERAVRMNTSLAVVAVDLDDFKQINDRHGHAAGDEALRTAATTMRNALRATDMIARVGGEEFLILLPDADADAAHLTADRLRVSLVDTVVPMLGSPVTASFGVAARLPGETTVDVLVKRADQAMYAAKVLGRNRVRTWSAADAKSAATANRIGVETLLMPAGQFTPLVG